MKKLILAFLLILPAFQFFKPSSVNAARCEGLDDVEIRRLDDTPIQPGQILKVGTNISKPLSKPLIFVFVDSSGVSVTTSPPVTTNVIQANYDVAVPQSLQASSSYNLVLRGAAANGLCTVSNDLSVSLASTEPDSESDPSSPDENTPQESQGDELEVRFDRPYVNENSDKKIILTISGLDPDKAHVLCTVPDRRDCANNDNDVDKDNRNFTPIKKGTTNIEIDVCGDGDKRVKIDDCDENDYFHGGNTYGVNLYEEKNMNPLESEVFYVTHYYPSISINSNEIVTSNNADEPVVLGSSEFFPISNDTLSVTISGVRPRKDKGSRNNYQLVLEAQNYKYKEEECKTVTESNPGIGKFGKDSDDEKESSKILGTGTYILKINDQNNESNWEDLGRNDCQGGFTFYHVFLDIKRVKNESGTSSLMARIKSIEVDPNETDIKMIKRELSEGSDIPLPCAEYDEITENCLTIDLPVLGIIGTQPIALIKTLGQALLSLSSIAAFIILIYAGYQILISRGDKEKIAQARELITSAVTGLIFIILSISILQIIGVDILRIPGFTRGASAPVSAPPDPIENR